jgi:hypothetical protein
MDIQFESLSPEQAALSNAKIIITTKDEAEIVKRKDVLLDTDLDKMPAILKANILRSIVGICTDDQLTIGIDPGNRIGVSVIYYHNEIESFVETSPESAVDLVSIILNDVSSKKKIVRIGDGNIDMARKIAWMIKSRFKESVQVEIVDEYGTSLPRNTETNRRGARDKSSARAIALRNGRLFNAR